MYYSKEEMKTLIETLTQLKGYEVLLDFFEGHLEGGNLEFGLSVPGSQGSAVVIKDLEEMFPDALFALSIDKEDLPLYINRKVGLEYPIACFRLGIKQ